MLWVIARSCLRHKLLLSPVETLRQLLTFCLTHIDTRSNLTLRSRNLPILPVCFGLMIHWSSPYYAFISAISVSFHYFLYVGRRLRSFSRLMKHRCTWNSSSSLVDVCVAEILVSVLVMLLTHSLIELIVPFPIILHDLTMRLIDKLLITLHIIDTIINNLNEILSHCMLLLVYLGLLMCEHIPSPSCLEQLLIQCLKVFTSLLLLQDVLHEAFADVVLFYLFII